MGRKIVAVLFLINIAFTSIFFFLGAFVLRIVTFCFDPKLRILHLYTCFWGSYYIWTFKSWRYKVNGKENIERSKTYVIVSNHQSQLDILIAFTTFIHFKWVSKIEVFNLPLIGWNMLLNRYIRLRRGDKKSISRMMRDARRTLKSGSSVYIFPEGTRSATGILRKFKPGAFILAKELNLPILPIVINGTIKALPKYRIEYRGFHDMILEILPPVLPHEFKKMSVEELSEYIRGLIASKVEAHVEGGLTDL